MIKANTCVKLKPSFRSPDYGGFNGTDRPSFPSSARAHRTRPSADAQAALRRHAPPRLSRTRVAGRIPGPRPRAPHRPHRSAARTPNPHRARARSRHAGSSRRRLPSLEVEPGGGSFQAGRRVGLRLSYPRAGRPLDRRHRTQDAGNALAAVAGPPSQRRLHRHNGDHLHHASHEGRDRDRSTPRSRTHRRPDHRRDPDRPDSSARTDGTRGGRGCQGQHTAQRTRFRELLHRGDRSQLGRPAPRAGRHGDRTWTRRPLRHRWPEKRLLLRHHALRDDRRGSRAGPRGLPGPERSPRTGLPVHSSGSPGKRGGRNRAPSSRTGWTGRPVHPLPRTRHRPRRARRPLRHEGECRRPAPGRHLFGRARRLPQGRLRTAARRHRDRDRRRSATPEPRETRPDPARVLILRQMGRSQAALFY